MCSTCKQILRYCMQCRERYCARCAPKADGHTHKAA